MTRSQLIDSVALRLGLDRPVAEAIVHTIFAAMRDALRAGHGIELRGFGSFGARMAPPYRGRNPRSGEPVEVRARRTAWFRIGRPLRARIEQTAGRTVRTAARPGPGMNGHAGANGAAGHPQPPLAVRRSAE